jgi:DNA-binding NtrC family response regulator
MMGAVQDTTLSVDRARSRTEGGGPLLTMSLRAHAPRAGSARFSLVEIDEVQLGRGNSDEVEPLREGRRLQLRLPDRWMSVEHARLVRQNGSFVLEDLGAKNGTYRRGARISSALLADGDVLELGHSFFVFRRSQPWAPDLPLRAAAADPLTSLLPRLAELRARVEAAAAAPLPIIISGETGTGKELVASFVHSRSGRSGPLVPVNCGALPAALVESELFGYKKGAFSGALEDRPGLVRASDGGTLFLDEIGELAPAAQVSLLRVIQEAAVRPLGSTRSLPVDLRLICATHRDLEEMVAQDKFRADLLARLNGLAVHLPPLRERREDLGLIVASLLARHAPDRSELTLSVAMARDLFQRPWPRNVREVELWLAAALALKSGEGPLEPPPTDRESAPADPPAMSEADQAHREALEQLLEAHGGNVAAVARELGKGREQVYRWIERYRIDAGAHRAKRS